ncbi:hypothetical protein BOTBODRAFT_183726 [Botryobasidium botryosum FD-172 SS1]|uniref:Uncharacterized protein n=1 Tax=Botryobasidium botryosum (strain FD-172 SS1) TaxID=930990 RepID=A0A067NAB1_BOTB1|nr:hypothetical protein BOTBODRAFT_183726 [Botryobasidium botryosum FD-172 SS1]
MFLVGVVVPTPVSKIALLADGVAAAESILRFRNQSWVDASEYLEDASVGQRSSGIDAGDLIDGAGDPQASEEGDERHCGHRHCGHTRTHRPATTRLRHHRPTPTPIPTPSRPPPIQAAPTSTAAPSPTMPPPTLTPPPSTEDVEAPPETVPLPTETSTPTTEEEDGQGQEGEEGGEEDGEKVHVS